MWVINITGSRLKKKKIHNITIWLYKFYNNNILHLFLIVID